MSVPESRENESEEEVEESDDEKVFLKPVVEDRNMALARKCTEMISDVHYKEEHKRSKGKCLFVPDTLQLTHVKNLSAFISEAKYKEHAKKELSNSLYKEMPATIDSAFAKEVTQLQSKHYTAVLIRYTKLLQQNWHLLPELIISEREFVSSFGIAEQG
ncbi:UNVERIFIED_CONTAM: hypothetical protein K2H54_027669 [Gekko kuhli]